MKKKNKELKLDIYEDDYKEDEIEKFKNVLSDNNDEDIVDDDVNIEYQEDDSEYQEDTKTKKHNFNLKKIINIVFVILIIIMLMIATDVICVARYDVGPFFALKTSTYKDGGTKVYYGFGYKVIKYHQIQGRRDMKIGFWTMPYSIEPTNISDLDLAINLNDNSNNTYQKYYKEFLRVNTKVKSIDLKKKTLTLGYNDEDGKYTLDIICTMAEKDYDLKQIETSKKITIIGTVTDFKLKSKKNVNTLYISNCFAEQDD